MDSPGSKEGVAMEPSWLANLPYSTNSAPAPILGEETMLPNEPHVFS